jgi:hypothetical protein
VCVSNMSCAVDVRLSCGLYPMVAVGEGYCGRSMLAKIFSSALCSGSRIVDCDRRAGVGDCGVFADVPIDVNSTGAEEYVLAMGVSAWDPQC